MKQHHWTAEELEIVRRDYRGTNLSADRIALYLNVTRNAVKGQAAKMGLLQQKSPPWSESELKQLSKLIHTHSISQIAKRLHRSPNAVKVKATRLKLGLRLRDDWFTKAEVCEICGVDHRKVQAWIDSGALVASWHTERKPQRNGMAMWHIEVKALRNFLINYSGELLGRNVDIQTIIWILVDA